MEFAGRVRLWAFLWPKGPEIKNFVFLSLEEAALVLSWRNHPEIRRFMFRQEPISWEEHEKFLRNLYKSAYNFYYLVSLKGPLGVVYLTNVQIKEKSTEIGLYRSPERKGVGKKLLEIIEFLAFLLLGLDELRAHVLPQNERAIRLYQSFGFCLEDVSQTHLTFVKRRS